MFEYGTYNVTFAGTVSETTSLMNSTTALAKAGYKIASITPQLTVSNANVTFIPEIFGYNDDQVIIHCLVRKGSGATAANPTCRLQVLYSKK